MPHLKAQPLPARERLAALRAAGDADAGLLAPDAVVSDLLVVVCPDYGMGHIDANQQPLSRSGGRQTHRST